jgi:hypothetical protein
VFSHCWLLQGINEFWQRRPRSSIRGNPLSCGDCVSASSHIFQQSPSCESVPPDFSSPFSSARHGD